MATPLPHGERRLLLVLFSLALLGHGARWLASSPTEAPGAITLLPGAERDELTAHRARVERAARPLGPTERIDPDRASALELERLPRVGPVLAKRIVADRERRGPFGQPSGLERVPGIGPGLLAAVSPHLAFSKGLPALTGPGFGSPPAEPADLVDLNRAGARELEALPGIGAVRARAIVAYREVHGPFATLAALAGVPGIGPRTVAQLEGLVHPP